MEAQGPGMSAGGMSGPLTGLRVIEMPAIGPVPFCGMLLADLGADVLRIDRTGDVDLGLPVEPKYELLGRGKRSLALDLKDAKAVALLLDLAAKADVIIEGFRPGVPLIRRSEEHTSELQSIMRT